MGALVVGHTNNQWLVLVAWWSLLLLLVVPPSCSSSSVTTTATNEWMEAAQTQFQLQGQHLRITVVQEGTFLIIHQSHPNKDNNDDDKIPTFQRGNTTLWFQGYIIDMIQALSERANFTYELRPPSGKGSDCTPQIIVDDDNHQDDRLYHSDYYNQYNCGANDVNELSQMAEPPQQATDIYAGMFYVSPQRQLKNWFTMPFSPPAQGTQVMYGTATQLNTIQDLVQAQQEGRIPQAACVPGSSANFGVLQQAFPELKLAAFFGTREEDVYQSMRSGQCPIHIFDLPVAAQFVLHQSQKRQCTGYQNQPIGLIGEPLSFGLTHYALGVGHHLSVTVVDTLSFWINVLMTCPPRQDDDEESSNDDAPTTSLSCPPQGNLYAMYQAHGGGTGTECGHVNFPTTVTETKNINVGLVTGLIVGGVVVLLICLVVLHAIRLRQQEQRYKYRFVEQIARNIEIGSSPGLLTPEKLAEEMQHIAQGKGVISKPDLLQWMSDVKLDFLSERDLNALWDAMDVDRTGTVDPMEFILFLSACGPQFAQVHAQHATLPKTERLKLAARRLTTVATVGEEGVRKIQYKLDRGSKELQQQQPTAATTTATTEGPTPEELVMASLQRRPWTLWGRGTGGGTGPPRRARPHRRHGQTAIVEEEEE